MQAFFEETKAGSAAGLQAMSRVLGSRAFSKAPRLCSLLEFIVVHSVSGRHDELTEQQIGIQVFGRTPGYNSSEDTIVRGTARHLRQRLDQYYATEGADDPVRIQVPRGGYVAVFEEIVPRSRPPEPVAAVPLVIPAVASRSSSRRPNWLIGALALVALGLLIATTILAGAYLRLQEKTRDDRAQPRGPALLWQALFTPDRKTLIVPGDASLDAFIAWEQRAVSLEEYSSQSYQRQATVTVPPTHKDVPLSVRSVTPMADLVLVSTLTQAANQMSSRQTAKGAEVRYARDMAVADTHDNNLILIGSESFNPWVTLYQPQMDFAAHFDFARDIYRISNRAPQPGEQAQYEYIRGSSTPQKALTHVALLGNGQGLGRVLIVEGTSMGTTYGAVNFLTHDSLWKPVLQQATDRNGQLRDFEVLLSGEFFHGGVGNTRVIALHVH